MSLDIAREGFSPDVEDFPMKTCRRLRDLVLLSLVPLASQSHAQLESVDEAVAISRKTGRPIFALAGQKT
jgi:hypothetical protein